MQSGSLVLRQTLLGCQELRQPIIESKTYASPTTVLPLLRGNSSLLGTANPPIIEPHFPPFGNRAAYLRPPERPKPSTLRQSGTSSDSCAEPEMSRKIQSDASTIGLYGKSMGGSWRPVSARGLPLAPGYGAVWRWAMAGRHWRTCHAFAARRQIVVGPGLVPALSDLPSSNHLHQPSLPWSTNQRWAVRALIPSAARLFRVVQQHGADRTCPGADCVVGRFM